MLASIYLGILVFFYNTRTANSLPVRERQPVTASNSDRPTVTLDSGIYKGTSTAGVDVWQGIPYAKPPVGNLRFRAPQDLEPSTEAFDAVKHTPGCIGIGDKGDADENCLHVSVYTPAGTPSTSKLPVYFLIPGGGFNQDSSGTPDGSKLVAAGKDMIVVSLVYRIYIYGFLASEEVVKDGSVNNGVKDIYKALQWVQKNIGKFGGDPQKVTIGGQSAGGGAVSILMTVNDGTDAGLFKRVVGQSPSFAPVRTIEESQYQYDNLVAKLDCKGLTSLTCLRGRTTAQIQEVTATLPYPELKFEGAKSPVFMFNPVVDGSFIKKKTLEAFEAGEFVKVPGLFGNVQNEGTVFTPHTIKTSQDSKNFLSEQFPLLSPTQLDSIATDYDFAQNEGTALYWHQASAAYGEIRYICTSLQLTDIFTKNNIPNWHYLYDVQPEPFNQDKLVFHGAELEPVVGGTITGNKNKPLVPLMQGFWTSFIKSGNPDNGPSKGWQPWTKAEPKQMLFRIPTWKMGTVDEGISGRQARCARLNKISVAIGQ